MKSMWNEDDRRELRQRIAALDAAARPRWGKMNAPQMVAHLTDATKMALGELPVAGKRMPLRYPPLKQLMMVLPFPKGAPTAPELIARAPAPWGTEIADLGAAMDRLVRLPANFAWPEHPAFGKLSRRAWGVLTYKHTDHHLRQFGV